MMFDDRIDAARQLAAALTDYRGRNPLVLAIPRGAVPMGVVLADALEGDLDVVLVHKLSSRWNEEYAVGAIDESGWSFIHDASAADADWLEGEKRRRLAGLHERRARYSPDRPPIDPRGRIVIVVDDGLATGATMIAALHAVRAQSPARLICAVPVAAPSSLRVVERDADETVCLVAPPHFQAVGQFYRHFGQVDDEEVIRCLRAHRRGEAKPGASD